ncbi:MAG: hypothetical protein NT121_23650 [Chloroflexi bacterium]|nr:hypothetical protein [Chloroflexota bacterium]
MTRLFIYVLITLGFSSLAIGWMMAGFWSIGLILLILLPVSLFLVKRKFSPAAALVLSLTVFAAAIGLWRGLSLFLALTAVLCALAAWDFDSFSRRLSFAPAQDEPQLLERQHLLWLSLVLILSVGISWLALSIHIKFNFEWAILLVVVMFSGISALVSWLRRKEG